jgi:hypothetical protein
MGPVRPFRLAGNRWIFWKPTKVGDTDGCVVRKRPLTKKEKKQKDGGVETGGSVHGLVPARKPIFLVGGKLFS